MLNMIDTQDKLKNFSEQQLVTEMQQPTGSAPQFMVLSEIERRKRMRQDAQRQEGLMQPTVAQEAISGAGVPQQGLAGIAQSLAPKTDMTQNTGVPNAQAANLPAQPNQPQRMADGGVLRLAPGGSMSGGTLAAIANLKVMRPDLYEEYKDDPEMLELTAEFVLTSAKDSEMTGLESLAAEQAASVSAADDFVARWPGDTPSQQAQVAKDKGDGGVAAALAAEADTRRRVAEENIAMGMPVPTNDFRTFPGPSAQTSVDALGVPLAAEDNFVARMPGDTPFQQELVARNNMPSGDVELDPFIFSDRTGVSRDGRTDEEILAEARAVIERYKSPGSDALAGPELTSQRRAVDTPAYQGLQDLLQERREYADSGSIANAKADSDRDDTLRFLRGAEGAPTDNRSLIDAIDRDDGLANSDEVISDNMGIRSDLFFPKSFPEVTSLNRRAQEYMQSDMYTPPEEIYDLSPQGRLKYENAPDGEFTTGTDGAMLSSEANAAINAVQKADSRRQEADSRRAATQNMRDTAASIASLEDFQIAPESGLASVVADTPPTAPAMGVQADIDRLRGIINDSKLPPTVRANAAQELQALQNSIAVNQYGGNLSAAANGIALPEGYIMGPLGPRRDPNYRSPGKTGDSLVDQAALQGTGALDALAQSGAVDPALATAAESIAKQADFERVLNPINQEIAEITEALDNPYVPADLKSGMEARIAELKTGIPAAASAGPSKLVSPTMDSTKSGYTGFIDPAKNTGLASISEADRMIDINEIPERGSGAVEAAAVLAAREPAKKTPITPVDKPGGGTTSSGSGQGRIADLIASRKKEADQNKWLALAQAGLSLMSTGDFGKAGQEGIKALMAQRESMNKFNTDMIKMESDLVLNNARLEAARRTGTAAANKSAFSASEYAALERAYSEAVERANQTKSQPDIDEAMRLKTILQGARTAVAAKFGVTGTTPTSGSGNYDVSSKTT